MAAVIQGSREAVESSPVFILSSVLTPAGTQRRAAPGNDGMRPFQHPGLARANQYDGLNRTYDDCRRAGGAHSKLAGGAGAHAAPQSRAPLYPLHRFRRFQHALWDLCGGLSGGVLLHCGTAQMAHFYGLPFQGGSGLDSCLPDAQPGMNACFRQSR